VQYFFHVTPIGVEDRTRVTLETVFETFVPIPVVTVEPGLIDLADFTNEVTQVDLKITNRAKDMFIETDCPYLAPVPYRGRRNEPAFVTEVARCIGTLRGVSPEEIGLQTSQNFRSFFRLPALVA